MKKYVVRKKNKRGRWYKVHRGFLDKLEAKYMAHFVGGQVFEVV